MSTVKNLSSATGTPSSISIARATFTDPAVFSSNTQFGDLTLDMQDRWGDVLQAVSFGAGKGRIALWPDSTVFSNFSMFMSGVPELALGYVEWLNRRNLLPAPAKTLLLLVLASICCFALLRLAAGRLPWIVPANIGLLFALSAGLYGANTWNAFWYKLPESTDGYRTIAFVEEFSHFDIPAKTHIHEMDPKTFESFYVSTQRQGYMPMYVTWLKDAAPADAICIVNPAKDFEGTDIDLIGRFVSEGGMLMVFFNEDDDDRVVMKSINSITSLFRSLNVDCHFHRANGDVPSSPIAGPLISPDIWTGVKCRLSIHGDVGKPLLASADKSAFATVIDYGRGKILLNTLGHLYSNKSIGEPGHVPTIEQLEYLNALYDIWKMIEGDETTAGSETKDEPTV